jgi:hypothetical protein
MSSSGVRADRLATLPNIRRERKFIWSSTTSSADGETPSLTIRAHFELTQRSLAQLQAYIWPIVLSAPHYYRNALENRSRVLQRSLRSKDIAWRRERRLEEQGSGQLLQVEHIGFLFTALLETAWGVGGAPSARAKKHSPSVQQESPARGQKGISRRSDDSTTGSRIPPHGMYRLIRQAMKDSLLGTKGDVLTQIAAKGGGRYASITAHRPGRDMWHKKP